MHQSRAWHTSLLTAKPSPINGMWVFTGQAGRSAVSPKLQAFTTAWDRFTAQFLRSHGPCCSCPFDSPFCLFTLPCATRVFQSLGTFDTKALYKILHTNNTKYPFVEPQWCTKVHSMVLRLWSQSRFKSQLYRVSGYLTFLICKAGMLIVPAS